MITFFYAINLLGASIGAQASIVMLFSMLLAFGAFSALGLAEVDFANFPAAMPNGVVPLLAAAALLSFATGGGFVVAELGRELKDPGRAIPIAILGGTGLVGVLYAAVAIPAAGVLPLSEVANQPLSVVAKMFLPGPVWMFFIIGGAMVAVVSTMNAQLLTGARALLVASDDGWIPAIVGTVSKRFGVPYVLLTILYILGQIPIWSGMDIGVIANAAALFGQILFFLVAICSLRMRRLAPWLYARSPFKLPLSVHRAVVTITMLVTVYQAYLLAQGFTRTMWIAVGVWFAIGVVLWIMNRKAVHPVPIQTEREAAAMENIERAQTEDAVAGVAAPTMVHGEHAPDPMEVAARRGGETSSEERHEHR
jgi:APA family basic amino acid/polyamine antiporter